MRNIEYWKQNKKGNENRVILILSGMFYRTFNEDARFLSHTFWFKIKKTWWYEVVGFPRNSLEQYLNQLKKEKIWYIVYRKDQDHIFYMSATYKWWNKIKYDTKKLHYIENNKSQETKFEKLLSDIKKLLLKYDCKN
jgi:hypothetical protein